MSLKKAVLYILTVEKIEAMDQMKLYIALLMLSGTYSLHYIAKSSLFQLAIVS